MRTPQRVKHLPENQVFIIMLLKGTVHLNSMDSMKSPCGLYMNFVESIGSPWKPVGDCKVERETASDKNQIHQLFRVS